MKALILLFLLSACFFANLKAQNTNFEDGFSDGDFTNNPTWSGNTNDFIISYLDGNAVLQLNASVAGSSYLSTASSSVVGEWEFFIRQDFSPSNNNRAFIYLMSDNPDLSAAVNGYYLRAGENLANDVFRLFRITNGVEEAEVLTGTTNISTGGGYRVKVTRDADGNWSLAVAQAYDGVLQEEATGTDNAYPSATHFGLKTNYTAGNIQKFYFDFKIDLPPVTVSNVEVTSSTEIDIEFSKEIDFATVQNTDFEILPGNVNPQTALEINNSTVRLTFESSLPGGSFDLLITGISDAAGETSLSDTTLSLFSFDEFELGDVIINEFLKDPPVGLAEYIELRNISSKTLNLKGWQIGDNGALRSMSSTDLVFPPNSFFVVASDTASLANVYGSLPFVRVALPALNNTTDQVRLYSDTGEMVDSLEYTPEWGGVKLALERRSSSVSATFIENWGNSPNELSGTPGLPNEIEDDIEAPFLVSTMVQNSQSVLLIFNERLDEEAAELMTNFSTLPSKTISSIIANANRLTLNFQSELINGETIVLTVLNQSDVFGNIQSRIETEFRYLELSIPQIGDIVVNEFSYLRANEDSPEFVELYNTSPNNFDLSGWEFQDAANNKALFPNGTFLEAGEYLVLTDKQFFASQLNNALFYSNFPSLNDAGDAIIIRDQNGNMMDSLYYDRSFGGAGGISVERKDPKAASNDVSNWSTSVSESGNTAGAINSIFSEDLTPPKIVFAKINEDQSVLLAFNEFISVSQDVQFSVNGSLQTVESFSPANGNVVHLNGAGISLGTELELSAHGVEDVRGNVAPILTTAVAQPLSKGDIIINELIYNPIAVNDDNIPDQSEYVELYNTRNYAISLEGFSLNDAPDEQNMFRSLFPVTSQFKWIPANGFFIVHANSSIVPFSETLTAIYFEIENFPESFTALVNRTSLSLSATNDAIFLSDSKGQTIDSVFYDETWHNPNRVDIRGTSLERINPLGPSDDSSNWSSSTDVRGGTPGAQNSIFQAPGAIPEETGISFSPNPFSPDDDGFEDQLFINYKLDEPDYLLRVRIFDRYGRQVRFLADGVSAGFEGNLVWDGLTDDNQRNRVGRYIVLFEAYNSSTGRNISFKKTVVVARRF